jgi:hypothetical protein
MILYQDAFASLRLQPIVILSAESCPQPIVAATGSKNVEATERFADENKAAQRAIARQKAPHQRRLYPILESFFVLWQDISPFSAK